MDGRAAILSLRQQCEGKILVKTCKNKAYMSIASSNYRGIRKQFTFAQYVAIHQAAHNELEDCNEPIPETKKVSDFLSGISDSSLEAGITCVLSEDRYQDSFEATQQFLGTLVANQMIHRQAKRGGGDERNESSTESRGNAHAKSKGKKKIEARSYPAEEWKQLTSEEQSKVIELKKQKANKAKDKKASKRKASSAESSKDKDEDQVETDRAQAADSDAAAARGGDEFGRGAHKKAKKMVTISAVSTSQALPTSRTIRHVLVVTRRVVMDLSKNTDSFDNVEERMELDTHAETCVAGSNTVVLDLTGKVASVSSFCDSEFQALEDVPIATVATAFDCAVTGKTHVLIFSEAHYFGDRIKHSLLCPNQLRANGLTVHDCPRQYDPTSTHSIVVPESDLQISLTLRGVISSFVTRVPSDDELADLSRHVEMTSDAEWEPYNHAFSAPEEARDESWKMRTIAAASLPLQRFEDQQTEFASAELNDMATCLIAAVRVNPYENRIYRSNATTAFRSVDAVVVRDGTRLSITPEDVAKRWNVDISTATFTLQVTTQPAWSSYSQAPGTALPMLEGDLLCGYPFLHYEVYPRVQVRASHWEWPRVFALYADGIEE
jgi:hypothetical protein